MDQKNLLFNNKFINTDINSDNKYNNLISAKNILNQTNPFIVDNDVYGVKTSSKIDDIRKKLYPHRDKRKKNITNKIRKTLLNIDSRDRIIVNSNIIDNKRIINRTDPIEVKKGSYLITIHDENHGFINGERIIIKQLTPKKQQLINPFIISQNSKFVIVNHINHGLNTVKDENIIRITNVNNSSGFIKDLLYNDDEIIVLKDGSGNTLTIDIGLIVGETIDLIRSSITTTYTIKEVIGLNTIIIDENDITIKYLNGNTWEYALTLQNGIIDSSSSKNRTTFTSISSSDGPIIKHNILSGDQIILKSTLNEKTYTVISSTDTTLSISGDIVGITVNSTLQFTNNDKYTATKFIRISTNIWNTEHEIIKINNSLYKIGLDINATEENITRYDGTYGGTIEIEYINIGGIPNRYIEADYPTNNQRLNGNHKISVLNSNTYQIKIDKKGKSNEFGGGDIVQVARVFDISIGYPNPNNYTVLLNKTFFNIIKIEMISTIIPNTQPVIQEGVNNKLYWQNEDDGNVIYSIELDSGNYTPTTLKTAIESKFSEVTFINNSTQKHNFKINIDTITNQVTFINIIANHLSSALEIALGSTTLIITHENHGLTNDDFILISDATTIGGIKPEEINKKHQISFISNDKYSVELNVPSTFATSEEEQNATGGGVFFTVNIFIRFRLLLDRSDTIGILLGFNNANNSNYILPPFNIEVKNTTYNVLNNTSKNGTIIFSGENYIYMTSNILANHTTFLKTQKVDNIFAKILFSDVPGHYIYNSYIAHPIIFEEPLSKLNKIDIQFLKQNGELYDFNGVEHSFSIEITEHVDAVNDTGLNTRSGYIKNYNEK
jgi:hypothetical protein